MVKVKEAGRLKEVYHELKQFRGEIIAEAFIGGGEYTCGILNGRALPSVAALASFFLKTGKLGYHRGLHGLN